MPEELARSKYKRRTITNWSSKAVLAQHNARIEDSQPYYARAHFESVDIEDVGEVKLGDCIEVVSELVDQNGQERNQIGRVEELFEDIGGERWCNLRWFYTHLDTSLASEGEMTRKQIKEDGIISEEADANKSKAKTQNNGAQQGQVREGKRSREDEPTTANGQYLQDLETTTQAHKKKSRMDSDVMMQTTANGTTSDHSLSQEGQRRLDTLQAAIEIMDDDVALREQIRQYMERKQEERRLIKEEQFKLKQEQEVEQKDQIKIEDYYSKPKVKIQEDQQDRKTEVYEISDDVSMDSDDEEMEEEDVPAKGGKRGRKSGSKSAKGTKSQGIAQAMFKEKEKVQEDRQEEQLTKKELNESIKYNFVPMPMDNRRVWLAEEGDSLKYNNDFTLHTIHRKVNIIKLKPGSQIPTDIDFDYWYDQEHCAAFYTFINSFKEVERQPHQIENRVLKVLDLYAGCGGLSFLAQKDDKVEIISKWAVDNNADACVSFQVNHPHAFVYNMTTDEFLVFIKMFDQLAQWVCSKNFEQEVQMKQEDTKINRMDAQNIFEESESDLKPAIKNKNIQSLKIRKILDISFKTEATRHNKGQSKDQMDEIVTYQNSELVFDVLVVGSQTPMQASLCQVLEHPKQLKYIVAKYIAEERLPRPQCCDVVVGGPPCQGVSGLNRHAMKVNVLDDPRNSQVKSFYTYIDFLQPKFICMEQVQDILRKENGIYAKFACSALVNLRYQVRLGLVTAGKYGCPQGRIRVIIWGAAPQEQLPAYPEPTHLCQNFQQAIGLLGKDSDVEFMDQEAYDRAYPMILPGDILEDLPLISNFTIAEQSYHLDPTSPHQLWLRRSPKDYECSLETRIKNADAILKPALDLTVKQHKFLYKLGPSHVGYTYLNSKILENGYVGEVHQAIRELGDKKFNKIYQHHLDIARASFCQHIGDHVMQEIEKIETNRGTLRDHRALLCNLDDYYRMYQVPSDIIGANIRQVDGVTEPADNKGKHLICAGHQHAQQVDGYSACPGGGTVQKLIKASVKKESRVDQYDVNGWRGPFLKNCTSYTSIMPTGDLLCPRWCVTYKQGYAYSCYQRIEIDKIIPTIFTRAEPHNSQVLHPTQARVLSIRENMRIQGFPDYYVLAAFSGKMRSCMSKGRLVRSQGLAERYKQIGNAVSPQVGSALGRCLLLAAQGISPAGYAVARVPDHDYDRVIKEGLERGLTFYSKRSSVDKKRMRSLVLKDMGQRSKSTRELNVLEDESEQFLPQINESIGSDDQRSQSQYPDLVQNLQNQDNLENDATSQDKRITSNKLNSAAPVQQDEDKADKEINATPVEAKVDKENVTPVVNQQNKDVIVITSTDHNGTIKTKQRASSSDSYASPIKKTELPNLNKSCNQENGKAILNGIKENGRSHENGKLTANVVQENGHEPRELSGESQKFFDCMDKGQKAVQIE